MDTSRRTFLLGMAALATVGASVAPAVAQAASKPPPLKIRGRSSSLVMRDLYGGGDIRMGVDHASGPDTSVMYVFDHRARPGDKIQISYAYPDGGGKEELFEILSIDHSNLRGAHAKVRRLRGQTEHMVMLDDYQDVVAVWGDEGRLPTAQTTFKLTRGAPTTNGSAPSRPAAPSRPHYTWPSPKRSRRR